MGSSVLAQPTGSLYLIQPSFDSSLKQESSSGHIKLIWKPESKTPLDSSRTDFQVEKAITSGFEQAKVVYTGDDLAMYLSGLADGTYYFRVRYIAEGTNQGLSDWSDILELNVKHHSLKLALILFVLGFLVFITTVVVLLKGLKDTDK